MADNPAEDSIPNAKSDSQLPDSKEPVVKTDLAEDQIANPNSTDDDATDKKTKMVSMTEARRKAVGYERKFCYIIGFPIDLDMEELVAEMINLGCKNPTDIKWYTDE